MCVWFLSVLSTIWKYVHNILVFDQYASGYNASTPIMWLKMRQRIEYKMAVLVYCCLNGLAPSYLANDLKCVADLDCRRRRRSSSTSALVVPSTRLSTVGDCAFPVAAARVWNTLLAECHLLAVAPGIQETAKDS